MDKRTNVIVPFVLSLIEITFFFGFSYLSQPSSRMTFSSFFSFSFDTYIQEFISFNFKTYPCHFIALILIIVASCKKKQSYLTIFELFVTMFMLRTFSEYFVAKAFTSVAFFFLKHLKRTEKTMDVFYSIGYSTDFLHAGLNIGPHFYHYVETYYQSYQINVDPLSRSTPQELSTNRWGKINLYCGECYNYPNNKLLQRLKVSGKCHEYAITRYH